MRRGRRSSHSKKIRFAVRRRRTALFRRRRMVGRRRLKPTSLNLRSPNVVPDVMRVKLKYDTFVSFAGAAGVAFDNVYVNSLFDPDYTGTGNQPLGYDEWSNFYGRYRVNGMSINVSGVNTNSTNPLFIAVWPSLNSSTPASTSSVLSLPYVKYRTTGQSSGNARIFVKNYMSVKKMFGYKSIDQEDDFTAGTGASPTNLMYFHVYGYSTSGSVPTFQGIVSITYYVEFYDRNQLAIS